MTIYIELEEEWSAFMHLDPLKLWKGSDISMQIYLYSTDNKHKSPFQFENVHALRVTGRVSTSLYLRTYLRNNNMKAKHTNLCSLPRRIALGGRAQNSILGPKPEIIRKNPYLSPSFRSLLVLNCAVK